MGEIWKKIKGALSKAFKFKKLIVIILIVFMVLILCGGAMYYDDLDEIKRKDGDWSNTPYAASEFTNKVVMHDDGTLTSELTAQELWDKMIKSGSNVDDYLSGPDELLKLMNAEILTQFPDTRENPDEEIDWDKILDIDSNLLQGIIKFKRADNDGNIHTMTYVDPYTFQSYIENYNKSGSEKARKEVLEHFTLGSTNSGGSSTVGIIGGTGTFTKYNLSESQLKAIANLCQQEQGSAKGAAAEASLMANRFELAGSSYGSGADGLYNYVRTSGWFAHAASYMDGGSSSEDVVAAVRAVLINGKRTVPGYIDEHDCFSDISSAANGGNAISVSDRSQYQRNVTQCHNCYGSTYTFFCFPDTASDPFGYTSESLRQQIGDAYYDYDTGNLVNGKDDNNKDSNKKDDNTKDNNSKDDNTKDNNSKDDNTKDNNSKDDNTKDDNSKDDNTKDDNTQKGDVSLNNFLFIGDSILGTCESGLESEGAKVIYQVSANADFFLGERKSPHQERNCVLDGSGKFDWNANLGNISNPSGIYLVLGQNLCDGGASSDLQNGIDKIKELVQKLQGQFTNVPIYINSVIPVAEGYSGGEKYLEGKNKANELLKEYCSSTSNVNYVDVLNGFQESSGYANPSYISGDHQHPNSTGATKLIENMKAGINGSDLGGSTSLSDNNSSQTQYYAKVATWNETTDTVTSNDPQVESYSETKYSMTTTNINYQEFVSGYTMPFDYLWAFTVIGDDKDFPLDLAELVEGSQIEITIHDNLTVTTTSNTTSRTETVKKGDEYVTKTYTTTHTTTTKNNTLDIALTLADVWIVKYSQEYTYEKDGENNKYVSSPSKIEEKTDKDAEQDNFVTLFLKPSNRKAKNNILEVPGWLFEGLESNDSTKDMVDLTKYLLYKATGKDFGVTEFDFSIFDPKNFKKVETSTTSMMDLLKEYIHYWEHSDEPPKSADGTKYIIEDDGAGHPTVGYGVDIFNGGFAEEFQQAGYPTSIGGEVPVEFVDGLEEREIQENLDFVKSTTNGLNLKDYQIIALVSRVYNCGHGGITNSYSSPVGNFVATYQAYWQDTDDQFEAKNSNANFSHQLYTTYMAKPVTSAGKYMAGLERRRKSEWTLFQTGYFDVLDKWYESSSGMGGTILECAKTIHEYMEANSYTYCVYGGNSYEECGSYGKSHGLSVTFEESKSNKNTCCATYVSWVLQETGYITDDEHNDGANNLTSLLLSKGWTRITDQSQYQPGDVLTKSNHVEIYAGDGTVYNAGSGNAIRSASPQNKNISSETALRPPN